MRLPFVAWLLLVPFACVRADDARWHVHPEWAREFAARGLEGTALVYDEASDRYHVYDRARAQARFSPASTFKLLNAMVALETGAVKDEYEVLRWDGVQRRYPDWNRDQSLASAMRFSAVWFYQEMARRAGAARMQAWLDRVGYGNRDIGGGIDRFWLTGALRISAVEQVAFLRRLARGELPFSAAVQETVRRITILDSDPAYILHGKTGWAVRDDTAGPADLGWFVGWVERGGRRWYIALDVDMPRGAEDAAQREPLARALLARVAALPSRAGPSATRRAAR
ncbi:class D beta-lactamase [Dokdonella sp.]|jgi:beta-lactamase class D|uniref:class D beta-lactamase n=1 Tax=Dokdonella sp. TaxID=2291710 RepID=UPI002F4122A0